MTEAETIAAGLIRALEPGDWTKCRKGSCHRHQSCMYHPCLSAHAHKDLNDGQD